MNASKFEDLNGVNHSTMKNFLMSKPKGSSRKAAVESKEASTPSKTDTASPVTATSSSKSNKKKVDIASFFSAAQKKPHVEGVANDKDNSESEQTDTADNDFDMNSINSMSAGSEQDSITSSTIKIPSPVKTKPVTVLKPAKSAIDSFTSQTAVSSKTSIETITFDSEDSASKAEIDKEETVETGIQQLSGTNTKPKICDIDVMKCDVCGKQIVVWEMPEHHDYHFAMDLQKQVNAENRTVNVATPNNSHTNNLSGLSGKKRKAAHGNKSSSKKGKISGTPVKTLDNFFKKDS